MPKRSAGILLFREFSDQIEVLLAHPGGPLMANKDEGVWSIPKGEIEEGKGILAAARREFAEETGFPIAGDTIPLEPILQPSGKVVYIWAIKGDCEPAQLKSNMFSMEWPPKSGRQQQFPEVDRANWFDMQLAARKILKGQAGFLLQLQLSF